MGEGGGEGSQVKNVQRGGERTDEINTSPDGHATRACPRCKAPARSHRHIHHRRMDTAMRGGLQRTLPAASRPTIRILISFFPNMRSQMREKCRPMFAYCVDAITRDPVAIRPSVCLGEV